jgi:predicted nuclease of predicted toxin-antitoxin system
VKLFFDENLSRKLVGKLAALFPGSTHVALEGLGGASDRQVWEFAKKQDFIIVTADADFYELVTMYGPPPKVIWLRSRQYPTGVAEQILRSNAVRVSEFVQDSEQGVLILTTP